MEIQRDGGALLSAVKKQFSNDNNGRDDDRKKSLLVFQSLERRWHGLWLKSLERQCLLETVIKRIELVRIVLFLLCSS